MKFLPSLSLVLVLCLGCGVRSARTPAEAHARLIAAVAGHDTKQLWNALDQDTRWSWMTIQRSWREAYDITQSAVPEGPERKSLLARFEPGAVSENAQTLFAKMLAPDDWKALQGLLAAVGAKLPEGNGETSEIVTPVGTLVYRKAHDRAWGWGFSGFAARAEQTKRTAIADLERVRSDAADYERAATRGPR